MHHSCRLVNSAFLLTNLFGTLVLAAPPPLEYRLSGDLGVGVFATQGIVRGVDDTMLVLPYIYADYGRYFARLDTLGVKVLGVGYGYLELIARVNFDGFATDAPPLRGLTQRAHSVPLGVGSFQRTAIGGFFLNAFHDVNKSNGHLYEAIYATKFKIASTSAYPVLGVEYRDKIFVDYYYGVASDEATASNITRYQPDGALNPFLALQVEIPLAPAINFSIYWRHKWLANSMANSPIIDKNAVGSGFLSMSYRIE